MDKILKIQNEIGALTKDKTANVGKFEYQYFDINQLLAELHPLLVKYNLLVTQPLGVIEGKSVLATQIFDLDKNGEQICNSQIILPDIQDPQKMGSAITYYRRYALQSLFLLQAEDDDANSAKPDTKAKRKVEPVDDDLGF